MKSSDENQDDAVDVFVEAFVDERRYRREVRETTAGLGLIAATVAGWVWVPW